MRFWIYIAVVTSAVSSLLVLSDLIWLRRHKDVLHTHLIRLWIAVDAATFPDLAPLMARFVLTHGGNLFRDRSHKLKALLFGLVVSWCLTSIFGFVAASTGEGLGPNLGGVFFPIFPHYVVNFVFDLATLVVTAHLLVFVLMRGYIVRITAILMDLALAASLVVICSATLNFIDDLDYEVAFPGSGAAIEEKVEDYRDIVRNQYLAAGFSDSSSLSVRARQPLSHYLRASMGTAHSIVFGKTYASATFRTVIVTEGDRHTAYYFSGTEDLSYELVVASTTFLPTAIYMLVLLTLVVSKGVLEVLRYAAMHYLERVTEVNPATNPEGFRPGALLAAVLTLIAVVAGGSAKVLQVAVP